MLVWTFHSLLTMEVQDIILPASVFGIHKKYCQLWKLAEALVYGTFLLGLLYIGMIDWLLTWLILLRVSTATTRSKACIINHIVTWLAQDTKANKDDQQGSEGKGQTSFGEKLNSLLHIYTVYFSEMSLEIMTNFWRKSFAVCFYLVFMAFSF